LFAKADLTFKEVDPPPGHWCKSGHTAPTTFRREGKDREDEPTKFFQVSSDKMPEINGVYCEPCIIIANATNRQEVVIHNPR
jgi:hypothetical protein